MNKIKEIIDYYFNIICIGLFIFLLTGICVLIYRSFNVQNKTEINEKSNNIDNSVSILEEQENTGNKIKVDIKGAVKKPGVYEIENGNNVFDLIQIAGGLKKDADTSNINLSRKLEDQMVIRVFTKNQLKKQPVVISVSECVCPDVEITDCMDKNVPITKTTGENINIPTETNTSSENNKTSDDKKIDNTSKLISINTATKEELMSINNIGEAKANAIIEYRNTNGNFKNIEDIKNVSGIGDSLFEKIKPYITI